jgi:hypothetical protein
LSTASSVSLALTICVALLLGDISKARDVAAGVTVGNDDADVGAAAGVVRRSAAAPPGRPRNGTTRLARSATGIKQCCENSSACHHQSVLHDSTNTHLQLQPRGVKVAEFEQHQRPR